jgi:alkyl sulfatase BDS1-like metallo-beta-lactamase superfamily hydrolase
LIPGARSLLNFLLNMSKELVGLNTPGDSMLLQACATSFFLTLPSWRKPAPMHFYFPSTRIMYVYATVQVR